VIFEYLSAEFVSKYSYMVVCIQGVCVRGVRVCGGVCLYSIII
jgi:hypothetical protein